MDQRSIKLLIIAFILVGTIVVVVSFNISARHKNSLSTTTSAPSTTTEFDKNNILKTTISSSSGNCLVNPNNSQELNSSYRVTKRNYQDSMEIDIADQDDTKVLCWTLDQNCYCFSTSAKKSYKWHEADQYCREGNMTLLSLESEEEDELIYRHIKSTPELSSELYWTSGQHNLRWEWASGGSFNYTNWKIGKMKLAKETYLYLDTNYNFESGYWLETFNSRLLSDKFSPPGAMGFICESNN